MKTTGVVMAVSRSGSHNFGKKAEEKIRLIAGLGVEGDAHRPHWIAYPVAHVIFQFYDGVTGELAYAESLAAR